MNWKKNLRKWKTYTHNWPDHSMNCVKGMPFLQAQNDSLRNNAVAEPHTHVQRTAKPICFASPALNSAERNYAQIEKEFLSIVFACEVWWIHLCQRSNSTHRSQTIGVHPYQANCKTPKRLQRMLLRLQKYTYNTIHPCRSLPTYHYRTSSLFLMLMTITCTPTSDSAYSTKCSSHLSYDPL